MHLLRTAVKIARTLVVICSLVFPVYSFSYEIEFQSDEWQLVSFPRLPSDTSVAGIFGDASVNGDVQAIWTFDNETKRWARWPDDVDTIVDSITDFSTGKGYWIRTSNDFTLQVEGENMTGGGQVLYPGWNLIGIVGDNDMPHEQAFSGVGFLELWRYNNATNGFQVVQKSGGSQIIIEEQFLNVEPTKGYWIYVTEQTSLVPELGTLLPPDIDIEPLLVMPDYGKETPWAEVTPGDIDWDEDGFFDFPNTQETLAFGDFLNRQSIAITNDGNSVLTWSASTEPAVDWLLFEAHDEDGNYVLTNSVRGNVADTNGELIAVVNRVGLAPSDNYTTDIVLRANGVVDEKRIQVKMAVADIVGDYEFTVRLDRVGEKQADLHNPKYFMSLARDGDGVKAFLDKERSLLIPETTYLSGTYVGSPENHFQILGQLYLPAGHEHNPYKSDIRREFTFIGQRSDGRDGLSPLDLKGAYNENVYGIFDNPIQLSGEFVARRSSPLPVSQDNTRSQVIRGNILSSVEDDGFGSGVSEFQYDFPERYSITDLKTTLKIDHTSPESLRIELIGPNAIGSVVLHDQESRSLSNLRFDDYDPSIESLDVFDGEIARGTWTLRITNTSENIGQLKEWSTDISGANVYQIIGQTTPGIRLQLSGCGVTRTVITDSETGEFVFDGLIPCDYEISVLQLGYEVTTTNVRIIGCYKSAGNLCAQDSDYIVDLTGEQLAELDPQLSADKGEMKVIVSPVQAILPNRTGDTLSVQAIDVTNYYSIGETLDIRNWSLFKRINSWTEINGAGYLTNVDSFVDIQRLSSLQPTFEADVPMTATSLDPYTPGSGVFYFDLEFDTSTDKNQIIFETGGRYYGLTLYQNQSDILLSIGDDNNIDLIAKDAVEDGGRYGLIVELYSANKVFIYIARMREDGTPYGIFKPIAVKTWSGSSDWSGGDGSGWGVANSDIQGEDAITYESFSGIWHLGRFYAGENVSLLSEAQRNSFEHSKNYISYSGDYKQWGNSDNIKLWYTKGTKDPKGGNSALKVTHSGNGSAGWVFRSDSQGEGSFVVSAGEYITISAFLKAGTTSEFRFRTGNSNTYLAGIKFDFVTGELIGGSGSGGFITESFKSVPLANGWYRVEATYQADTDYGNFHCDAWYLNEGTFNVINKGYVFLYGPQCEKHASAEDAGMTAYIPTGYNHGSRTDTAIKVTSKTQWAAIWNNRFTGHSDQAGEYFVTLDSNVRDRTTNETSVVSYQTEDILLQYLPTDSVHLGAFSPYAAAGTTSLKAMDTATFDINRPPLENTNGPEDSDSFTGEVDEATQTNQLNNLLQNAANPGQYSFEPSGFNDPVGNPALHYRMHVSTGQLIFSPSAYSTGFRVDQGIQTADTDDEDEQAVYNQSAGGQ